MGGAEPLWLANLGGLVPPETGSPGSPAAKYKVTARDVGKRITVRITAKKAGYLTVAKTSAAVTIRR
ncbi:MAG: hypothetical protein LBK72_06625 [Bifidobacteriaceae bacterium]|nr:hypothetical protein [Bifidobacteriaceae bacterium]